MWNQEPPSSPSSTTSGTNASTASPIFSVVPSLRLRAHQDLTDKPTEAVFFEEEDPYAASLHQQAAARAQRLQRDRAPPPWAPTSDAPAYTASPRGSQRYLPQHLEHAPAAKVNVEAPGAEVYSEALQSAASARQQRYARQPLPFAVREGEGGMSGAPGGDAYHIQRRAPEDREPSCKVTASASQSQQQVEDACRERAAAQEAARQRNRGTAGLLG